MHWHRKRENISLARNSLCTMKEQWSTRAVQKPFLSCDGRPAPRRERLKAEAMTKSTKACPCSSSLFKLFSSSCATIARERAPLIVQNAADWNHFKRGDIKVNACTVQHAIIEVCCTSCTVPGIPGDSVCLCLLRPCVRNLSGRQLFRPKIVF